MPKLMRYAVQELPHNFLDRIQRDRLGDDYWEQEAWNGWDGLEDIVDAAKIDIRQFEAPEDFWWKDEDTWRNGILSSAFDETFEVEMRNLPDAVPGDMFYFSDEEIKSAQEISWIDRLDDLSKACHDCKNNDIYTTADGVFVLYDNGEIIAIWTFDKMGQCAFDVSENYRRIESWNGSVPDEYIGCDNFEWNW